MTGKGGRRAYAAISVLAAGAVALTGCSSGGGGKSAADGKKDEANAKRQQAQIEFGDAAASTGPAEEVAGAKKGGTMQVLQRDSYAHLDPAQMYVSDEGSLSRLIHRGLTSYKADSKGKQTVVGDLATDSGTVSDGGKTWKYTLKEGVKFSNGDPITSKDVRHTFERQFADFVTEGPTFVQQWFAGKAGADYRKLLPDGPFKGKHLPDSLLETPDDKTVVFHFKKPQADLPYALAMAGYSMVSEKGDTKKKYDKKPVTSGPYKIQEFKSGKSMTLVKNDQWDPKSDPTRNQYVDKFAISFNHQYEDSSKRLLSDAGENKTAVSFNNSVDAASLPKLARDAAAQKRSVDGYQPYVGQMAFNLKHSAMKDKKVREAVTYALPITAIIRAVGGPPAGEPAGGLISPTLTGYEKGYDPYGKLEKPGGDPEKAKETLKKAGKTGMKLTYGYINTPEGQQASSAVADSLKKAGFNVQRQEIPAETYYDVIGKVDNKYDIYNNAWGADWPSSSTVIPPLYDGRQIADGAPNYSHVNDPKINKEIDRINAITDQDKASKEWFKLNKYIVEDVLPTSPTFYYKQVQLFGSKVGGVVYDDVIGGVDPRKLYLK